MAFSTLTKLLRECLKLQKPVANTAKLKQQITMAIVTAHKQQQQSNLMKIDFCLEVLCPTLSSRAEVN